uniref:Uncharacterized protein n=1 Tax=Magnetospirillum gryphiswaldense TaxID=55518 RepID=A4U4C0_9PROT|nr:hypothetical protein MGR_3795 [Magnetospirillum gryphiswaldense MSR-1]
MWADAPGPPPVRVYPPSSTLAPGREDGSDPDGIKIPSASSIVRPGISAQRLRPLHPQPNEMTLRYQMGLLLLNHPCTLDVGMYPPQYPFGRRINNSWAGSHAAPLQGEAG